MQHKLKSYDNKTMKVLQQKKKHQQKKNTTALSHTHQQHKSGDRTATTCNNCKQQQQHLLLLTHTNKYPPLDPSTAARATTLAQTVCALFVIVSRTCRMICRLDFYFSSPRCTPSYATKKCLHTCISYCCCRRWHYLGCGGNNCCSWTI